MDSRIQSIIHLLSCPDDGTHLSHTNNEVLCRDCGRIFPTVSGNFIELLPVGSQPLPLSSSEEYRRAYLHLFNDPVRDDSPALAWGAEELAAVSWVRKRKRQVCAVSPVVTRGVRPDQSVLCDFAAGAGYYTRAYARHFRCILHCDLSVDNLNYCRAKARTDNLNNIVFLRIDYFRPPFRDSLDRIICFDTIIRGGEHDRLLLQSVIRSLRLNGGAVIDFHNWWHNPLRRVGLLPENFSSNKSYSRKSAEALLNNVGIKDFEYRPFYQEFDARRSLVGLCRHVLPATRLVYSVSKCDSSAKTLN